MRLERKTKARLAKAARLSGGYTTANVYLAASALCELSVSDKTYPDLHQEKEQEVASSECKEAVNIAIDDVRAKPVGMREWTVEDVEEVAQLAEAAGLHTCALDLEDMLQLELWYEATGSYAMPCRDCIIANQLVSSSQQDRL